MLLVKYIRLERKSTYCREEGYVSQEYDRLAQLEQVAHSSEKTINLLTDSLRKEIMINRNLGETNSIIINMVGWIN